MAGVFERTAAAALLGAAAALALLSGCPRRPEPEPTSYPTPEQLTANRRAVGIPYDQYVLLRNGSRLAAIRVTSRSARGERISYQWAEAAPGSNRFDDPQARRGEGETAEQPFEGYITIPGLTLTWSRGSAKLGWIYWPEEGDQLAVYSHSWPSLDQIDPGPDTSKWLRRDMFSN